MGYMVFKKLAEKLVSEREKHSSLATNPLEVDFDHREKIFLNKMTHSALNMYERKCDIKNFSELALSDPENESHNDIMNELFENGVKDPFEAERLSKLTENQKFLRDLGLID